ncbi:hypothetical protein LTR54_018256, partial [Friedmanniomyces endolithicus]
MVDEEQEDEEQEDEEQENEDEVEVEDVEVVVDEEQEDEEQQNEDEEQENEAEAEAEDKDVEQDAEQDTEREVDVEADICDGDEVESGVDGIEDADEVEGDRDQVVSASSARLRLRLSGVQQQTWQRGKKRRRKSSKIVQTPRKLVKPRKPRGDVDLPADSDDEQETPNEPICLPSSKIDTSRVDFRRGRLALQHSAEYTDLVVKWEKTYRGMLVELCTAAELQLSAIDNGTPQSEHLHGLLGYLRGFEFAK